MPPVSLSALLALPYSLVSNCKFPLEFCTGRSWCYWSVVDGMSFSMSTIFAPVGLVRVVRPVDALSHSHWMLISLGE